MQEPNVEPHVFVILGSTGDLTRRKLLPALYHLRDPGSVEKPTRLIVGAALPEMSAIVEALTDRAPGSAASAASARSKKASVCASE